MLYRWSGLPGGWLRTVLLAIPLPAWTIAYLFLHSTLLHVYVFMPLNLSPSDDRACLICAPALGKFSSFHCFLSGNVKQARRPCPHVTFDLFWQNISSLFEIILQPCFDYLLEGTPRHPKVRGEWSRFCRCRIGMEGTHNHPSYLRILLYSFLCSFNSHHLHSLLYFHLLKVAHQLEYLLMSCFVNWLWSPFMTQVGSLCT